MANIRDLVVAAADTLLAEVKDQHDRFGLGWTLAFGRVIVPPDPQATADLKIIIDGDQAGTAVPAINLAGTLVAGARVALVLIPPSGIYAIAPLRGGSTRVSHTQTASSTVNTNVYQDLTNIAGVAFIGPPSGSVTIDFTAFMSNDTATGATLVAPAIFSGSTTIGDGTAFLTAPLSQALVFNQAIAGEGLRYGSSLHVEGLTPYEQYNVSLQARTGGVGISTLTSLHTIVDPTL